MSISYRLLSHVNLKEKNTQTLNEHLTNVASIMVNLARNKGVKDSEFLNVLQTIGMCHDFGKGSEYFQQYLINGKASELKNHGEVSAYLAYYLLPDQWKRFGFIAVKRHHGNIDSVDNMFFTPLDDNNLKLIIKSLKNNKSELDKIYNVDLKDFFELMDKGDLIKAVKKDFTTYKLKCRRKEQNEMLTEYIYFQYVWSLLLTADKSQLVRGKEFTSNSEISEDITKVYKENLRDKLAREKPGIENSPLFKIREDIYNTAILSVNTLNLDMDHTLSINVPTGTGKTISVYGAALRLKERILVEKDIVSDIIYCLPFTSVIDQNYDVLETMLSDNGIECSNDIIMKYHSLTPIEYKINEDKQYTEFDEKFLLDNWQSTIITTTFVQLFNAIFKSGINCIMHRFHKLIGSIIILDEVQAIDPKYHRIIEEIFKILSEKFNCYIITVTATKPLFLSGKELITNNKDIFNNMNRIEFHNFTQQKIALDEFKNIVQTDLKYNEGKSFLIILNTIACAKEVNEYIKDLGDSRKVYYLSTELLPIDRLEIIKEIRNSKEKTILISTQLIEAGVDIDYDIVYRDIAPLDSINQSAGRANRNGIGGKGIVKLYSLIKENQKSYSGIYSSILIETTIDLLKEYKIIKESEIFKLNNLYFKEVAKATKNQGKEICSKFIDYMKSYNFKELRDLFKLIEENNNKMDVIVNSGEVVSNAIETIKSTQSYKERLNAWTRLNEYRISVNKSIVNDIYYEDIGVKFIDSSYYDKECGIIKENTSCI